MQCDVCGTEVRPEHKFCVECGARLADQPRHASSAPASPAAVSSHPMFDPHTGQLLAIGPGTDQRSADAAPHADAGDDIGDAPNTGDGDDIDGDASVDEDPAGPPGLDPDATKVLPALGRPETTFAPPDPTPGAGLPWSTVVDTSPTGRIPIPPPPPAPGIVAAERDAAGDAEPEDYPPWPGSGGYAGDADLYGSYDAQADQPTRVQYLPDDRYTGPPQYVPVAPPPPAAQGYEPTGLLPATYQPWEDEADQRAVVPRTFRVKPLLIVAVLAAAATVAGVILAVISVDAPGGAADLTGEWKVNDFATNFAVAGILVAVAVLLGAVAWCYGFRWGAGLAGGAGAGLAGWAVLPLGLAEVQLSSSEAALGSSAELVRDLGYWCLVGAGGAGILVLLISLLRAGNDRRAGLDPWVAALGAIATVVAAIGPLIPLNGADLSLNWSSAAGSGGWPFPAIDLPSAFFAARFANLGVGLLCGVFGFLLVRRYGLGLAIGAAVGNGWLLLTSATGQTTSPLGPAYLNPGAEPNADGLVEPYVVTIAGVALVFFFGLVAVAMAVLDSD